MKDHVRAVITDLERAGQLVTFGGVLQGQVGLTGLSSETRGLAWLDHQGTICELMAFVAGLFEAEVFGSVPAERSWRLRLHSFLPRRSVAAPAARTTAPCAKLAARTEST